MMGAVGLIFHLFQVFFLIGMFTFGGGYAVITLVQNEVVFSRAWITESTFTDIVAISQITPGPVGLNCSTYVGYEVLANAGYCQALCTIGSFTASIAVVLPSFIIVLALVKFYTKFHEHVIFKGALSALKPTIAGLIGASALALTLNFSFGNGVPEIIIIRDNFIDWKSWALAAAALFAYLKLKMDPITILFAGGILGLLLY